MNEFEEVIEQLNSYQAAQKAIRWQIVEYVIEHYSNDDTIKAITNWAGERVTDTSSGYTKLCNQIIWETSPSYDNRCSQGWEDLYEFVSYVVLLIDRQYISRLSDEKQSRIKELEKELDQLKGAK